MKDDKGCEFDLISLKWIICLSLKKKKIFLKKTFFVRYFYYSGKFLNFPKTIEIIKFKFMFVLKEKWQQIPLNFNYRLYFWNFYFGFWIFQNESKTSKLKELKFRVWLSDKSVWKFIREIFFFWKLFFSFILKLSWKNIGWCFNNCWYLQKHCKGKETRDRENKNKTNMNELRKNINTQTHKHKHRELGQMQCITLIWQEVQLNSTWMNAEVCVLF